MLESADQQASGNGPGDGTEEAGEMLGMGWGSAGV